MKVLDKIGFEAARGRLDYNPVTGTISCKVTGLVLDRLHSRGYLVVSLGRKHYELSHRLAILLTTGTYPEGEVDHINGNKLDNSITNLRVTSKNQNQWNSKKRSDNVSGVKGVNWSNKDRRWVARIQVNGRRFIVGYFRTIEEATTAISQARVTYHGEFANHG